MHCLSFRSSTTTPPGFASSDCRPRLRLPSLCTPESHSPTRFDTRLLTLPPALLLSIFATAMAAASRVPQESSGNEDIDFDTQLYEGILDIDTSADYPPSPLDEYTDTLVQACVNYMPRTPDNEAIYTGPTTPYDPDIFVGDIFPDFEDRLDDPLGTQWPSLSNDDQSSSFFSHMVCLGQELATSQGETRSPLSTRQRGLTTGDIMHVQYQSPSVQVWAETSYATGSRVQHHTGLEPRSACSPDHLELPESTRQEQSRATLQIPSLKLRIPDPQSSTTPPCVRATSESGTAPTGSHRCQHPDCNHVYDGLALLRHHSRCHLPMKDRKYACSRCPLRFLHPKDLSRHALTHDPNHRRSFFCHLPHCNKCYTRKDHLTRHIKTKHLGKSSSVSPTSTRSPLPGAIGDWEFL